MIKNEKQFWTWWTGELKTWFTTKFSAITSSASSISNKIGAATDTKEAASIFGKIAEVKHSVENLDTSDLAKRSDVKSGDNTTIGMLENPTYGLYALKNAISQGSGRIPTDQFNALAKDATVAKESTLQNVQASLNNEATEADIYDMFNISGTCIPTNASVSDTTATIQGTVSGTTATIQGSVIF